MAQSQGRRHASSTYREGERWHPEPPTRNAMRACVRFMAGTHTSQMTDGWREFGFRAQCAFVPCCGTCRPPVQLRRGTPLPGRGTVSQPGRIAEGIARAARAWRRYVRVAPRPPTPGGRRHRANRAEFIKASPGPPGPGNPATYFFPGGSRADRSPVPGGPDAVPKARTFGILSPPERTVAEEEWPGAYRGIPSPRRPAS